MTSERDQIEQQLTALVEGGASPMLNQAGLLTYLETYSRFIDDTPLMRSITKRIIAKQPDMPVQQIQELSAQMITQLVLTRAVYYATQMNPGEAALELARLVAYAADAPSPAAAAETGPAAAEAGQGMIGIVIVLVFFVFVVLVAASLAMRAGFQWQWPL